MAVPTGVNGLDGLGFLSVHDPELPAEPFEFGQRRVRRARIDGTPGIEYQIEIAIFHLFFSRVFSKKMQVEIEGLKEMAPTAQKSDYRVTENQGW